MIKVIASDIDGTLLPEGQKELHPKLFDLILQLKKLGIHFIAASGRQLYSQQLLFAPIKDEISYISENGAICMHQGVCETISEFEPELTKRIIEELEKHPYCKVSISTPYTQYIKSGDDDFYHYMTTKLNYQTTPIDSFWNIKDPIIKIAFLDTETHEQSFSHFKSMFQSEIGVVTAGNLWVDFVPFYSNKGVALKFLLDKLGASPSEAISFGDQLNDLEMLDLTETSYAMTGAQKLVHEHATHTTDSVESVLQDIIHSYT